MHFTYDKLPQATGRAASYLDIFKQGADILESDLPIEVAETIKPMTPNKYCQRKKLPLLINKDLLIPALNINAHVCPARNIFRTYACR